MPFTQNFYGNIGSNINVENLNGTVAVNGSTILTPNSGIEGLAMQLRQLSAAVAALQGEDPTAMSKAAGNIQAAERETQSERPNGAIIKQHLDEASGTLQGVTDATSKAFSLAKVLVEVGVWAVAILT